MNVASRTRLVRAIHLMPIKSRKRCTRATRSTNFADMLCKLPVDEAWAIHRLLEGLAIFERQEAILAEKERAFGAESKEVGEAV